MYSSALIKFPERICLIKLFYLVFYRLKSHSFHDCYAHNNWVLAKSKKNDAVNRLILH